MASSAEYPKDARTKAKRYAKRGAEDLYCYTNIHWLILSAVTYDKNTVHDIVNASPILHVSFNGPRSDVETPRFPTILPMLGAVGRYPATDDETVVYLHGSSAARLFRLDAGASELGLPVCIAATVLDGYVLALTPFNHSCNYRSAVLFGCATKVTDPEEALYAMELITDHMVTDRWANSRTPPSKSELIATGILRVGIETASVKVRNGGPHDDRKDLKDEEVTGRVWTGVVPVYQVLGDPVESPENKVKRIPDHVEDWVRVTNKQSRDRAIKALEE